MRALESYNVVWKSQSQHSGESMPVGGHDIGLNVWVERGELLFYIDRSGSFDENNQMLKLGRVRLRLDPNPFVADANFHQELRLRDGCLAIAGSTNDGLEVQITLWVEVFRPIIHLELTSNRPLRAELCYENWRRTERELAPDRRMSALSANAYPGTITTQPDHVQCVGNDIQFYHRNRDDKLIFDKVVELQGLAPYKERLWNPQLGSTFGGMLRADGLEVVGTQNSVYIETPYTAWTLRSSQPQHQFHAAIYLHSAQTATLEQWQEQLSELVQQSGDHEAARTAAQQWWNDFWERSFVEIDTDKRLSDEQAWQVGRNYALFRYMLGCNAFGDYPTKFNGGLFTSDPWFVLNDPAWKNESADFRRWGGGSFTAQNQRLVYWPLLKSGDFELMPPQFEFYRRALGNAELRSEVYWGHGGCSFTEQLENFGLPIGWGWGWHGSPDSIHNRTPFLDRTEQVAPWIKYYYTSQLEFAFMMLQYQRYSGNDLAPYLPFIESAIRFFDEHYQYMFKLEALKPLDEHGKLVIFPSTACETYKLAMNPTDAIAALDATVRALLDLPDETFSAEHKAYYRELLGRIPPISLRDKDGTTVIAPAEHWKGIINVEIPQLYPVFPYDQYGLGRDGLQIARDTWQHGTDIPEQKNHISWHQDAIFCARLGLTDEAAAITIQKLTDGDRRFPAFWGPGHDWLPDHNWGGSGMIGLQEMLLQTNGDTIYLLPAWPREWDVAFKLHAPGQMVVEGRVANGEMVELMVTPASRRADVINLWETPLGVG